MICGKNPPRDEEDFLHMYSITGQTSSDTV